jgi:hypothetical protein
MVTGSLGSSASRVTFWGAAITQGIYAHDGSSLIRLVDSSTSIPGGTGNFSSIGDPSANGNHIIFRGTGSSSQQGIYRGITTGTLVSKVADHNSVVPGGAGATFVSFTDPCAGDDFSNFDIFGATLSDGREGLYLVAFNGLSKLLDTSDILDGKVPVHFFISREAIENDHIAFKAIFADGSQGVFAAILPIPEPQSLSLLAIGIGLLCRRRPPGR